MKLHYLKFLPLFAAIPLFAQHDEHAVTEPVAVEEDNAAPSPATHSHVGHATGATETDAAVAAPDPHAGHTVSAEPPAADPHAGHTVSVEPAAADPHAGHTMPAASPPAAADPHAGHTAETDATAADVAAPAHDMEAMIEAAAVPEAQPPAEAFSGPAHAADTLFDPFVMAQARELARSEHGDFRTFWFMADQMESRVSEGKDSYVWNAQGWYGGDINKLWLKTEGEGDFESSADQAEVQALWSHAIAPWFDFQAGIRHDFRPGPQRSHLVLGVQGLAPYQFEIDAAAFISDAGDLSARLEAEYDLLLTQRLILQPRIELNLAADDVAERGIGSGLNSAELGLRLRYQVVREFSPYIGVEYERLSGNTAKFASTAGEDTAGWNFLMGARIWF